MKNAKIITLLWTSLALTVAASGQVTDWNAIKSLTPGTKIHVALKRGRSFGHCFFDVATDEELVCTHRAGFYSRRADYPRDNIKAVYRAHNAPAIGAGIGAGTGTVIGATRSSCCRGAYAVIDAGAFALLGGFVGLIADPFVHGGAMYRTPTVAQPLTSTPVVTKQDSDPAAKKIPCLRDGVNLRCVAVREDVSESGQTNLESTTSGR
jgi:hypothetical protein